MAPSLQIINQLQQLVLGDRQGFIDTLSHIFDTILPQNSSSLVNGTISFIDQTTMKSFIESGQLRPIKMEDVKIEIDQMNIDRIKIEQTETLPELNAEHVNETTDIATPPLLGRIS